jgi:CDP-diacylglycerol--serine O-phosphatidyltransferase
MLRGQSRFGAELDSLSDVVAFGVAPALIIYLWVLQVENSPSWRTYGWVFALAYAVCMALRLARFNARIDAEDQPHKSAGFLTGVPAPAGAGMMLLPILLWLASDRQWSWLERPELIMAWSGFSAFLIISSIATFSLGALRVKRSFRLQAVLLIVLVGGALFAVPWETLSALVIVYLLSIPFSVMRYAAVKRRRARQAAGEPTLPLAPPLPPVPPKAPARHRRSPPSSP